MTAYPKKGPFHAGAAPPMDVNFCTDLETWLGYGADSAITTNGSGQLTVAQLALPTGTLTRIKTFSGTGTGAAQTVSHGLGATPDLVIVQYAGNFGSPPTHPAYYFNTTSTQVTIVADNGYSWNAIAFKF